MKYVVFSDSHTRLSDMEKAVISENPCTVIHLGDCTEDADVLRREFCSLNICAVRGNNDCFSDAPTSITLDFGHKRIFACHGHTYGVRQSPDRVIYAAKSGGCDIALFGHTHKSLNEYRDGILVVNPGSIGFNGTYAVLVNNNGIITAEIKGFCSE